MGKNLVHHSPVTRDIEAWQRISDFLWICIKRKKVTHPLYFNPSDGIIKGKPRVPDPAVIPGHILFCQDPTCHRISFLNFGIIHESEAEISFKINNN
jgi:hypothetical protein